MRNHRFVLRRDWIRTRLRIVNFIMLNPSTADEVFDDDATIRRCIGFAKTWGFTGIVVTNLFAFRATDPEDLRRLILTNPALAIGEGNDEYLRREAETAEAVVCAWGDNSGLLPHRSLDVVFMLRHMDLLCIRTTKKGNPAHPVRERYTNTPELFMRRIIPREAA